MIDLHMHILPGIDDGAEDLEEALEMAHMAAESGAKGIVATSHGNIGDLTAEEYWETFNYFHEKLRENNIPVSLYPGMEIFMGQGAEKKLSKGELLTVNNTKYVLTEFDFYEDIWRVNSYLELLSDEGYIPIIAHPERYHFVQQNPQEVFFWAERGYVTQMNKGSVLGAFGKHEQDIAMSLLRHNLINVIASDAHGTYRRTPDMGRAMWLLFDYFGDEYVNLLQENSEYIIKGEDIERYDPLPYDERPRYF